MAFQEKSAWIMALALVVGGAIYAAMVAAMSSKLGYLAPPVLPLVAIYTVVLAVVAAVGHAVIAVLAPREASAPLDERERLITERAGHRASYVLAAGVVAFLGLYLVTANGSVLFYGVFASLMLSQLAEYILQIARYRAGA